MKSVNGNPFKSLLADSRLLGKIASKTKKFLKLESKCDRLWSKESNRYSACFKKKESVAREVQSLIKKISVPNVRKAMLEGMNPNSL